MHSAALCGSGVLKALSTLEARCATPAALQNSDPWLRPLPGGELGPGTSVHHPFVLSCCFSKPCEPGGK